MNKLFVDKTIQIDSPAVKVWDVLTKGKYTDQWTNEFMADMIVESDWKMGSTVVWKDISGKIVVEGDVTKVEPKKFLRYTTFDVETGRTPVTQEDGITFQLAEHQKKTKLHVLHGDFATMKDGQKYYDMTLDAWNKILPKIKELAESD